VQEIKPGWVKSLHAKSQGDWCDLLKRAIEQRPKQQLSGVYLTKMKRILSPTQRLFAALCALLCVVGSIFLAANSALAISLPPGEYDFLDRLRPAPAPEVVDCRFDPRVNSSLVPTTEESPPYKDGDCQKFVSNRALVRIKLRTVSSVAIISALPSIPD